MLISDLENDLDELFLNLGVVSTQKREDQGNSINLRVNINLYRPLGKIHNLYINPNFEGLKIGACIS